MGSTKCSGLHLVVQDAILLREYYLERLRTLVERSYRQLKEKLSRPTYGYLSLEMPQELTDALDLYRLSSVEVVEAIRRWKLTRFGKDAYYYWNGVSYLGKMVHDTDFLSSFRPLTEWLGFNPLANPFILSEQISILQIDASLQLSIGRYATACVNEYRSLPKSPSPEPSPYATAIINDAELCPRPVRLPSLPSVSPRGCFYVQPKQIGEMQVTSYVSTEDLVRMRRAEQVIWCETATKFPQGRWPPSTEDSKLQIFLADGVSQGQSFACVNDKRNRRDPHYNSHEDGGAIRVLPESTMGSDSAGEQSAEDKAQRKFSAELHSLCSAGTTGHMRPVHRPERMSQLHTRAENLRTEIKGAEERFYALSKVQEQEGSIVTSIAFGDEEPTTAECQRPPELCDGGLLELCDSRDSDLQPVMALDVKQTLTFIKNRRSELVLLDAVLTSYGQAIEGAYKSRDLEIQAEKRAMQLEDRTATHIQKRIRGILTRLYAGSFKAHRWQRITRVQALGRGMLARRRHKRELLRNARAQTIQSWWRYLNAIWRVDGAAEKDIRHRAALRLQMWMRQIWARQRYLVQLHVVQNIETFAQAVESLTSSHLRELSDLIAVALSGGRHERIPPLLLSICRLMAAALNGPDDSDHVQGYDSASGLISTSTDDLGFGWGEAFCFLRRSRKLLRRLRALAFAFASSPGPVLPLSPEWYELADEVKTKAVYSLQSMSEAGTTSEALYRIFLALDGIGRVQLPVNTAYAECVPSWLERIRLWQQRRRYLSSNIVFADSKAKTLAFLERSGSSGKTFQQGQDNFEVLTSRLADIDAKIAFLLRNVRQKHKSKVKQGMERLRAAEQELNVFRYRQVVRSRAWTQRKASLKALRREMEAAELMESRIEEIVLARKERLCQYLRRRTFELQLLDGPVEYPQAFFDAALSKSNCLCKVSAYTKANIQVPVEADDTAAYRGPTVEIEDKQAGSSIEEGHSMTGPALAANLEEWQQAYEAEIRQQDRAVFWDKIRPGAWDDSATQSSTQEDEEKQSHAKADIIGTQTDLRSNFLVDLLNRSGAKRVAVVLVIPAELPLTFKKQLCQSLESVYGLALLQIRASVEDLSPMRSTIYSSCMHQDTVLLELEAGHTRYHRQTFVSTCFALRHSMLLPARLITISYWSRSMTLRHEEQPERELTLPHMPRDLNGGNARVLSNASTWRELKQYSMQAISVLCRPSTLASLRDTLASLDNLPTSVTVCRAALALLRRPPAEPYTPTESTDASVMKQAQQFLDGSDETMCAAICDLADELLDLHELSFVQDAYLRHEHWPAEFDASLPSSLVALAEWVVATVKLQKFIHEHGNLALGLSSNPDSKASPFDAVVEMCPDTESRPADFMQVFTTLLHFLNQKCLVYVCQVHFSDTKLIKVVSWYCLEDRLLVALGTESVHDNGYCCIEHTQVEEIIRFEVDEYGLDPPADIEDVCRCLTRLVQLHRIEVHDQVQQSIVCVRRASLAASRSEVAKRCVQGVIGAVLSHWSMRVSIRDGLHG